MPTNQEVINAVYAAAGELGIGGWELLTKAKLTHLVRDRQEEYTGTPIEDIDTLTDEEKTLIKAALPPVPAPITPPGQRKPLEGKGLYIWRVSECEEGKAQVIAARAQQAGLTHVLIKIGHGPNPYRYNIGIGFDQVAPLVNALRTIPGFQVWGWQYTFGEEPEAEAQIAVDLVQQYKMDGFVINAEKEYKRDDIKPNAPRYTETLRRSLEDADLEDLPVALSSYRYPIWHRRFAWAPFLELCTIMMPQVYWVARSNPDSVSNLHRCLDQYRQLGWTGPVIPTGAAYDEMQYASDGTKWPWSTGADEIRLFLPAVKDAGLQAVNFWSWEHVEDTGPERWQAIAEFQW
jgi:hypothetical protein